MTTPADAAPPPEAAADPDATVTLSADQVIGVAQSHHAAGRLATAERIYRKILQAVPDHPRVLYLLGMMALQINRYDVAEGHFRAVIRQRPDNVDTLVGLSSALHHLGRLDEAEQYARGAIRRDASNALAHTCMGRILLERSQQTRAVASYARAVELQPKDPALMTGLLYCMSQDEAADPDHLARMHRQFGKKFGTNLRHHWPEHANPRDPDRRLRVGFVSGDLRQHAVAYFVEPVWRAFDRARVEVFAYSNLAIEDAMSLRLKGLADHWRPVLHLDDDQLSRLVQDDGIDILVDLSGHTVRNRLLAFARKPAPVQVSWIGYPETTGLTAMDYYLADPHSAPPGAIDELYVEKIVRLPASVAFQPDPNCPDVGPLPALRKGHFTFGSFNRLSKVGPTVLATWARVLQQVPGSRLLLLNVSDDKQADALRQRFAEHGVAAERLSLERRQPLADYFRLHHEVDVMLDTFPYTGGTTTQHALWMGVPVITMAGRRRSERISTANLARVGLEDWSVPSIEAYVARAVAAANDLEGLAALRAGLRERIATSPLRQADTIAHGLELAFRVMWQRWCQGLPPEAFAISLEQASRRRAP